MAKQRRTSRNKTNLEKGRPEQIKPNAEQSSIPQTIGSKHRINSNSSRTNKNNKTVQNHKSKSANKQTIVTTPSKNQTKTKSKPRDRNGKNSRQINFIKQKESIEQRQGFKIILGKEKNSKTGKQKQKQNQRNRGIKLAQKEKQLKIPDLMKGKIVKKTRQPNRAANSVKVSGNRKKSSPITQKSSPYVISISSSSIRLYDQQASAPLSSIQIEQNSKGYQAVSSDFNQVQASKSEHLIQQSINHQYFFPQGADQSVGISQTPGDHPEYSVQKVISSKIVNGEILYQIKWAGYPSDQNTFQPVKNLDNVMKWVIDFQRSERKRYERVAKQKSKQASQKTRQVLLRNKELASKSEQLKQKNRKIDQMYKQIEQMSNKYFQIHKKFKQLQKQRAKKEFHHHQSYQKTYFQATEQKIQEYEIKLDTKYEGKDTLNFPIKTEEFNNRLHYVHQNDYPFQISNFIQFHNNSQQQQIVLIPQDELIGEENDQANKQSHSYNMEEIDSWLDNMHQGCGQNIDQVNVEY